MPSVPSLRSWAACCFGVRAWQATSGTSLLRDGLQGSLWMSAFSRLRRIRSGDTADMCLDQGRSFDEGAATARPVGPRRGLPGRGPRGAPPSPAPGPAPSALLSREHTAGQVHVSLAHGDPDFMWTNEITRETLKRCHCHESDSLVLPTLEEFYMSSTLVGECYRNRIFMHMQVTIV